jgi:hypothetical protein
MDKRGFVKWGVENGVVVLCEESARLVKWNCEY